MKPRVERRHQKVRRDFNDLVRDEKTNRLSTFKIGGLVGQWLAVKLILEHSTEIIKSWDVLTVLFSILIAPALLRRLVEMKFGGAGKEPK